MSDTHINAFFGDVDEKRQAVVVAQGELQAAEDRLEAKKKEVGYVEPESATEGQEDKAEPVDDKKTAQIFGRK